MLTHERGSERWALNWPEIRRSLTTWLFAGLAAAIVALIDNAGVLSNSGTGTIGAILVMVITPILEAAQKWATDNSRKVIG